MRRSKRLPPRSSRKSANAPAACCGGRVFSMSPRNRPLVPAKAGTQQNNRSLAKPILDSRFRGNERNFESNPLPLTHDVGSAVIASRFGFIARCAALDLRRFRFGFWPSFGFRRRRRRFDAAEPPHHGVGGALAGFPSAAHCAPQRLVRGL